MNFVWDHSAEKKNIIMPVEVKKTYPLKKCGES